MESIFGRFAQGGHRPPGVSIWPGTSPSPAAVAVAADAVDSRPRVRGARRTATWRPPGGGRVAAVHDRQGDRAHARAAAERAAAWRARDRAVLPESGRLPAGLALQARSRRAAGQRCRATPTGERSSATSRARPAPTLRPAVLLRPWPVRRRRRGGGRQRGAAGQREQRPRVLRDRLSSACRENDVPNAVGILQNLSGFPSLADRLQQGFLDFLFIGRTMIHPGGFAANPLPGGRQAADRHAAALLLRQQPGRDRGRRAHRGGP